MARYTKQDILRLVEEEDVRFIRLQFTDILGQMRNMAITASRLMDALENRCMFDGSAIGGFAAVEDSDMYLYPDLDTFEIFPWRPHPGKVARLICDVYLPDGKPFEGDPRYVLKKTLQQAETMGYTFQVGPECEFFLFDTDDGGNPTTIPGDDAGYFDLAPVDHGENCRREICLTLEEMNFKIEASHHEMAPGQHEVDFRYGEALMTADRIMTFKTVVKTIAKRHGLHATFMPKPLAGKSGSGMHINMSLFKQGKNIFSDSQDSCGLSKTAYAFLAGLLQYTPEMSCILNPTVNSYKRLAPGFEAPCYISWSENNRSLLVRIPAATKSENTRLELRSPDATANPYLAIAACLRAGILGIQEELVPPSGIDINVYSLSEQERAALGVKSLPVSLNEALGIARSSGFVTDLLGEKFAKQYLQAKQEEYDRYRQSISQWEVDEYLVRY